MKWGVIGTGDIADAFASTLAEMGRVVRAVGSRSPERAEAFARRHGVTGPAGLVADVIASDVEAVYVASTNANHHADTVACLAAGIPVLCEKPFALDLEQAVEMAEEARRNDIFLMEAMWTLFLPVVIELLRLIETGAVGQPRRVTADFGAVLDPVKARLWEPAHGGGALLDLGVYPLTLAHRILGGPIESNAVAHMDNGVDVEVAVASLHAGGARSILAASMVSQSPMEAVIEGTDGTIRVHAPFHHPTRLTVTRKDSPPETLSRPFDGSGYRFEIEEVEACVQRGQSESQRRPLEDTLAVMRWMDDIRSQVGIRYPAVG